MASGTAARDAWVLSELVQLMKLKDDARQTGARQILEKADPDALKLFISGLTLYKYRSLEDIRSSHKLYGKTITDEMVEICAGLRWGMLSPAEEKYWALQTQELVGRSFFTRWLACKRAGSSSPLQSHDGHMLIDHPLPQHEPQNAIESFDLDVQPACLIDQEKKDEPLQIGPRILSIEVAKQVEAIEFLWKCGNELPSNFLTHQCYLFHEGEHHAVQVMKGLLDRDQRRLFACHALRLADQLLDQQAAERYVEDVWRGLNDSTKRAWSDRNSQIRRRLRRDNPGWLDHLITTEYGRRNESYLAEVTNHFKTHGGPGRSTSEPDRTPEVSLPIKRDASAVRFLYGSLRSQLRWKTLNVAEIVLKTLRAIEFHVSKQKETRLTGRSQGMRLNYDPLSTDVDGIASRLRCALEEVDNAETLDRKAEGVLETLLRPLLVWNLEK